MNIALWSAQVLLALVYFAAGGLKVVRPYEELIAEGTFGWMKSTSGTVVKAVGWVEILGALGVVLPQLTQILPLLTPLAAIGLALVQVGAVWIHRARHEHRPLPVNVALLLLAVFTAAGRHLT